ncbi:MAG: hypothetical protein KatS3mg026_1325 [Bacteroidia bacterium]|nr:MAG: hypothetical protein KatS3mg026_1325 [Bacteroidia bacterium]
MSGGRAWKAQVFEVILRTFPAVLVAQADGFTDTSEVQRLEEIVAFLCKQEKVPLDAWDWRAEMRYLAIDSPFWRERFMAALRELLQTRPELYREQAEFLFAVAAASTGDITRNLLLRLRRHENLAGESFELISASEKAEIERLIAELGFADKAPEALSYLRQLLAQAHG